MIHVTGIDHFVLRIRDLERSLAFYRDVLGLPIEFLDEYRAGTRPFVSVRIGGQLLDLVPDPTYDAVQPGGYLHGCLEVDDRLDDIVPWLCEHGVEVLEDQPMVRMGARGMGPAIYIRDPDGYIVELKERLR